MALDEAKKPMRPDRGESPLPAGPSTVDAGPRLALLSLYPLVFCCGAILMCVEIVGSMMLAPTFGSGIFTWGSIIGVFMAALAAGYYCGGLVADRYPRFLLLCALVFLAGLATLPIAWLREPVCQAIVRADFGPRGGPLLAAAALYLLPSLLLGMVSPFAVRLAARDLAGLGNVAGRLYALSTVGSILGTLLTTFWLIPTWGTRGIIWGAGLTLLVAAAGGALWWSGFSGRLGRLRGPAKGGALTLFTAPLILALPVGLFLRPEGPGVRVSLERADLPARVQQRLATPEEGKSSNPKSKIQNWKDSPYHLILVTEQEIPVNAESGEFDWDVLDRQTREPIPELGGWRKRRCLRFNEQTESAIYVDEGAEAWPGRVESAVGYTEYLHLGLLFHARTRELKRPAVEHLLVVGCGGGIAPMEFRHHYGAEVDVADIDAEVFRFAENWMRLAPDAKLRLHVGDGRRFIVQSSQKWDYIILDAYTTGGRIPFHLVTREFYQAVREHLAPGGVLVSNVIAAVDGKHSELFRAVYKTQLAAGFGAVYVFPKAYRKDIPVNIILVALPEAKGEKRRTGEDLAAFARTLAAYPGGPGTAPGEAEGKIRVRNFTQNAQNLDPRWPRDMALDSVPLLTDDYAPVDTMYGTNW